MTRRRRIVLTLLLVGVVSAVMSPGACAATPLLSGYGGPGSGEQVILGSQVVNQPGAHKSSPVATATSTAQAQSPASGVAGSITTTTGGGSTPAAGLHRDTHTSTSTAAAHPRRSQPVLVDTRTGAQAGPALSNNDLLMAAIALCALAGVAVLTRQMARLER